MGGAGLENCFTVPRRRVKACSQCRPEYQGVTSLMSFIAILLSGRIGAFDAEDVTSSQLLVLSTNSQ